jgi:TRAP-type C4-dicarboxylate transport system permease small subunit
MPAPRPSGAEKSALDWLRLAVEAVTVALFSTYCAIVLAQVFFRYVLNDSLIWSEETVRFEQFWVIMLATGLCAYRRAHIRLEGFEAVVPRRYRRSVEVFGDVVTIACCGFLLWYGVKLVLASLETYSPAMQLSMAWPYAAMPVGAALTILWTVLSWFGHSADAQRGEALRGGAYRRDPAP